MNKDRNNFRRKAQINLVDNDDITFDAAKAEQLPKQVQAVLALYEKLLQNIYRLSAAVMDKRAGDVQVLKVNCLSILKTLDAGLKLNSNLAINLHTLYGHCMRRLAKCEDYLELEAIDSVRMVIYRIRDVYMKVSQAEAELSSKSLANARVISKRKGE